MQVLLTAINSKYIHTGLGLRYVKEYARQQGYAVSLLEETINTPILAVLEKLMATKADVYGFSVHIWNKPFVFRLVSMLKKLKPKCIVVLGGPEVSFAADRIFVELPVVDYIVQGEGELVFSQLLESIEKGTETPRHIAYMKEGRVQLNGGATVVEDMSMLPFPYPDLEQVLAEHKIVYYECTRGCPFRCAYCLSGITHRVRKRPLELVLQDIDRFIAAGASLVKFVDRTYNLDERYFLPMMEHLAKADTKATFHFEIKADMLSERVMDFLATVPKQRFQMEIGIQSTNPPTLKAINRQDDWEKLAHNIKRLLSYNNMHIHVDLIAGLPYEGLKEFKKSFDDVSSLGADMLQMGFLKVLPGTQMAQETREHGLLYMDEPPYEILATNYMPYEELQLLKRMDNVHDQTGNCEALKNILAYLIRAYGKGNFAFYERLTNWWVAEGHYPQSHNLKGVAQLLHDFILQSGAVAVEQQEIALEILRYDVFVDIPGWYPSWLKWQGEHIFEEMSAFWRDEERVLQYLPQYKFATWRQIHKLYPTERFDYRPDGTKESYYILLDCLTKDTKIIEIEL